MIKIREKRSQKDCHFNLECVEYALRMVRGTSAALSALIFTTAALNVKGKTGKRMDTRRSARSWTSNIK